MEKKRLITAGISILVIGVILCAIFLNRQDNSEKCARNVLKQLYGESEVSLQEGAPLEEIEEQYRKHFSDIMTEEGMGCAIEGRLPVNIIDHDDTSSSSKINIEKLESVDSQQSKENPGSVTYLYELECERGKFTGAVTLVKSDDNNWKMSDLHQQ